MAKKNGYEQMRDDVIKLQGQLSTVTAKDDPGVVRARNALQQSRSALESLWFRSEKSD